MRTTRLARWLISGALVTASAVTVHWGQTVESGMGVTALSSESAQDEAPAGEPAGADDGTAQPPPVTTTGFEWA